MADKFSDDDLLEIIIMLDADIHPALIAMELDVPVADITEIYQILNRKESNE